jgi:hypothetical protein
VFAIPYRFREFALNWYAVFVDKSVYQCHNPASCVHPELACGAVSFSVIIPELPLLRFAKLPLARTPIELEYNSNSQPVGTAICVAFASGP